MKARKRIRAAKKKAGLSPGTPIYLGPKKIENTKITVFDYDLKHLDEVTLETLESCPNYREKPTITWINIDGLHDIKLIKQLGEHFSLHSLVLEDIVNIYHRAKLDDFEDQLFLVLKMVYLENGSNRLKYEHLSMVVGEGYVITFQETEGDVFKPVRDRIRAAKGRLRKLKSDYLAYALIDVIVDGYFIALERLEEQIEPLENEVFKSPTRETLANIHALKQEVSTLKKAIWPLREIVSTLQKEDSKLVEEKNMIFIKDLYDHVIQALDAADSARESLTGLTDLYMSEVSNRLNETMKVLTVMASIFIPLTFVVGIYGMNFKNMPELEWEYGYLGVWILILTLGFGMLAFLKKRKWM